MSDELNNMQEFAIQDEVKTEKEMIDPLDVLINHDFVNGEELDLEESYEILNLIERENKSAKMNEAENVIQEFASIYIDTEYQEKLDKSFENIKAYIRKYNIELDEVKNLTDSEKTKVFAIGSFLNKNVGHMLNDIQFNLYLTRDEYKFISIALEQKLSYDGNEVFNIIELNEKYLKEWTKIDKSLPKQVPGFIINIDIRNVVMLYHFLGKHSVKGLGKEFYTFASILKKIADTNKLFNAYNILVERLNTDFRYWTGALEPETVAGFVPEQE